MILFCMRSRLRRRTGSCEGVLNIIKEETVLHDPYLQRYSENPYVNAVLAARRPTQAHCGIVLESNVELGAVRLKTIEFCAILNDMLTHASTARSTRRRGATRAHHGAAVETHHV